MAEWYVGSAQYSAITQWAALTAYSVGDIRRQLAAPAVGSERAFRCTTAGTSGAAEPTWTITKAGTTNDGSAVWTEVTGNSTYAWAAASARLLLIFNTWAAAGDTIYVAQNHAETQTANMTLISVGSAAAPLNVYCVNASGSVPPVAADLATTGDVITTVGGDIAIRGNAYIYGLGFLCGTGANEGDLILGASGDTNLTFKSCRLSLVSTSSSSQLIISTECKTVLFDNTVLTFGGVGQAINNGTSFLNWRNTPSALGGATIPTTLFTGNAGGSILLEGVDLSAAGAGKTLVGASASPFQVDIVNCGLHASVTVAAAPTVRGGLTTNVIISDSGANTYRQERTKYEGVLTTEVTFVMDGGADDGVTPISWKVVTTANSKRNFPFETFKFSEWNTTTGSTVTATVEIENGGLTLTDADIWVEFEYLGNASYPLASVASTAPATPLTAAANLPTSSVTWNGGLGSAVKQYMQATFTPEIEGYVRATVYVARASTTLYINPQVILS